MRVRFRIEPRDLWVGLFWDHRSDGLHLFVCPLPTVLVHDVHEHPARCPVCHVEHARPHCVEVP
jgi:hypothetical protein